MTNFKRDLETGQYYENLSIDILLKHGFENIEIDGKYNPYYDITATKNNKKVYIECKYNSYTDKTGYIFLECCKRNLKASGISITTANYYIFYSKSKYWICGVNKVKNILKHTICKELKKVKVIKPTNEQLLKYIEYEGIKTKNSIGVLIDVKYVNKKSKYKGGLVKKSLFN
jgi:hypothetical protein